MRFTDSSPATNHESPPASEMARFALILFWGAVCGSTLIAPVLAAHSHDIAAGFIYLCFSPVCHQIPDRCYRLSGHTLAVCHRCFGIYLGLLLGSLAPQRYFSYFLSHRRRRCWAIACAVPLILDALLPWTGFWTSTAASRFSTGLLFGLMVSSLLVRGLAELLSGAPWNQARRCNSHANGGFS
jgi:uncharacterized membrane protein